MVDGSCTGERQVTQEDRAIAIKRELINSRTAIRITPGMKRALAPAKEQAQARPTDQSQAPAKASSVRRRARRGK